MLTLSYHTIQPLCAFDIRIFFIIPWRYIFVGGVQVKTSLTTQHRVKARVFTSTGQKARMANRTVCIATLYRRHSASFQGCTEGPASRQRDRSAPITEARCVRMRTPADPRDEVGRDHLRRICTFSSTSTVSSLSEAAI